MNADQAARFLRMLGCTKISFGSEWVRSTCPMVHLHSGGRDRTPSFAIRVEQNDKSNCRCLACGVHGDPMMLVWRLEAERGIRRPDVMEFLVKHNQLDVDKIASEPAPPPSHDLKARLDYTRKYVPGPARGPSTFVHPDDEPQAEVPEHVLQRMRQAMPDYVRDYLVRTSNPIMGIKGRNLDLHTIEEWELGWHALQRRICIPIRDESGKLVALSGRKFDEEEKGPKYLHSRFKRDRVLFGEHRRDPKCGRGFLFEGFFQTIYSAQLGYRNTFARMGTHLSRQQTAKLADWLDHLTIVPDGDKAGRDAAERDALSLRDLIPKIDIADMPDKHDIDDLNRADAMDVLGPVDTA